MIFLIKFKYDIFKNIQLVYVFKNIIFEQIVGLTASPGMGKAKTMAQAHGNIKTLMANLDVTIAPVQVRLERGNLTFYQPEAQDGT